MKRNKLVIHTTEWMNLKCIMLNERSQIQKVTDCMIPFTRYLGKSKTTELENRSEGAAANGRGTFGGDRNVLYLHCGYTAILICQNSENCILKRVDYTVSFLLFSRQVVSDSLQTQGLHAAHQASCPSLSPGVCSISCPLSQ